MCKVFGLGSEKQTQMVMKNLVRIDSWFLYNCLFWFGFHSVKTIGFTLQFSFLFDYLIDAQAIEDKTLISHNVFSELYIFVGLHIWTQKIVRNWLQATDTP